MQSYTWFYSLQQPLSPESEARLKLDFDQFLAKWKSHGTPVEGLIRIYHNQFVIIQSNPAQERPSGCSIDSLKRAVGQILDQHRLDVVDASQVFFRNDTGKVESIHFSQIPTLIGSGTITAETQVFDHSLGQSDDLSRWELPLKHTWLKRYLPVGSKS